MKNKIKTVGFGVRDDVDVNTASSDSSRHSDPDFVAGKTVNSPPLTRRSPTLTRSRRSRSNCCVLDL
jgi:hypothetical protein